MPAQLATIPLKLIQPHPKLACRFDYAVAPLADSIKSAVDDNTPNGQLNPGRVVLRENGEGYYVYIGIRRYYALKQLYETTGDERFAVYVAYIDAGLSELQMFIRAKKENEEERGERLGFSALEEVIGVRRIRDAIKKPEELDGGLKRLLQVANRIDEDRLRKLHEVEQQSGFKFRLAHLERLCAIEEAREFYLSAATMAGFHFTGEEAEKAVENKDAAYNIRWFKGIFPEFAPEPSPESRNETEEEKGGEGHSESERFPIYEESVVVVRCPACSVLDGMQVEGKVEATCFSLASPKEEHVPQVPETVSRFARSCTSCQKEFYAFVKHVGGRTYAVETSLSKRFREPKALVEALDLGFDSDKNTWLKLVDGRPVGVLRLPTGAGKKATGRAAK